MATARTTATALLTSSTPTDILGPCSSITRSQYESENHDRTYDVLFFPRLPVYEEDREEDLVSAHNLTSGLNKRLYRRGWTWEKESMRWKRNDMLAT
jgi:hypothetical protein